MCCDVGGEDVGSVSAGHLKRRVKWERARRVALVVRTLASSRSTEKRAWPQHFLVGLENRLEGDHVQNLTLYIYIKKRKEKKGACGLARNHAWTWN